jgi:hypothetical protein
MSGRDQVPKPPRDPAGRQPDPDQHPPAAGGPRHMKLPPGTIPEQWATHRPVSIAARLDERRLNRRLAKFGLTTGSFGRNAAVTLTSLGSDYLYVPFTDSRGSDMANLRLWKEIQEQLLANGLDSLAGAARGLRIRDRLDVVKGPDDVDATELNHLIDRPTCPGSECRTEGAKERCHRPSTPTFIQVRMSVRLHPSAGDDGGPSVTDGRSLRTALS